MVLYMKLVFCMLDSHIMTSNTKMKMLKSGILEVAAGRASLID